MRTTVNWDDELLKDAKRLTGMILADTPVWIDHLMATGWDL
jgi:hypothetical protein